jgi:hypothetical protein
MSGQSAQQHTTVTAAASEGTLNLCAEVERV